jgi:hypothetical protein
MVDIILYGPYFGQKRLKRSGYVLINSRLRTVVLPNGGFVNQKGVIICEPDCPPARAAAVRLPERKAHHSCAITHHNNHLIHSDQLQEQNTTINTSTR